MATKHFLTWVENQARILRSRLALRPLAPLDPFELAKNMCVDIIRPSEIPGLRPECLDQLLVKEFEAWSAGSLKLPSNDVVVVLNPTHAKTRERATLMEELSHIHLGHSPTQLIIVEGGPVFRTFKKSQETEAYWVGAAALVPKAALERAKSNDAQRQVVARFYGVSPDLVRFRENVTGLRLNAGV